MGTGRNTDFSVILLHPAKSRQYQIKGDPKQFWHTHKPFMHCKRSNNEGTYHLKENGVLVTDKRKVAEIDLQQLFFSYSIQNVGEEHDSDSNVAVDISVHPSIAATREDCVAAQFEFNHVSKAETEFILKS